MREPCRLREDGSPSVGPEFGRLAFRFDFDPVTGPCPADLDADGLVGVLDLLQVLGGWGTPDGDVDGNGITEISDLLAVLAAWGPCA